jgi:hypothetical protein
LLVPWFDQQTAVQLLAGRAPTPDAVRAALQTWTIATEALRERRPPTFESALQPLPPELLGLAQAFAAQSDLANNPDFPGAEIRLVELASLLTFQARIATDAVTRQLIDGYDGSLASIFRLCLPLTGAMESLQVRMEGATASVISPNPNLRFGGFRIAGGALTATFGFRPPWVQVAMYRGRPFVRNGYHRCALLLGAGARYAVAVVSPVETLAELGAAEPGYIAESHLLGATPPMLRDFADARLAATIAEPATQRIVRLTASEFTAAVDPAEREQAHE